MKIISILSASAFGLALCGSAFAADTPSTPTQNPPATNTQQPVQDGGSTGDVNTRDRKGDDGKLERDYQAEVKKCDTVSATEKQKCLDAAAKKRNPM